MSLLNRFATVVKSNLNDLVNRAEDPEKVLNHVILEMREQVGHAKADVAAAIAEEKRLRAELDTEVREADEWERKAKFAVEKGDDALAKDALRRKAAVQRAAAELRRQWEAQAQAITVLKTSLRDLNDRVQEAKRKRNILIARQKRAEAQTRIHRTMAALTDTSAFDTFDRMEEKVEGKEALAAAMVEVSDDLSGRELEMRFERIEEAFDVDAALAELKSRMGR